MAEKGLDRALRLLSLAVPALAAAAILGLLLVTSAPRLSYPYDLEWMEGGLLVNAWRVQHGLSLYPAPGPEYIGFIYPPLYSWILAALGSVFGLGAPVGRVFSLLCSLVAAAMVVVAARGERAPWGLSLAGAGLYLSCFEDSGAFYDLVRIDGLSMALLTASLVLVRREKIVAGGLMLAVAFVAKQHAAVFGLPALIWLWRLRGKGAALRFAAWSALPALAFVAAMSLATGGRFLVYLVGVPGAHPFVFQRFLPGTPKELFVTMPLAVVLVAAVGVLLRGDRSEGERYWAGQGLVAVLICAVMRGHHGGFVNVLMPAHWAMALLAVVAGAALLRRWPTQWLHLALGVALSVQIGLDAWSPARFQPTDEDRAAGDALIARLADIDGDILAPYSPFYPVLAGKTPFFALIALWDIDHPRGPYVKAVADVKSAMSAHRWAAVLVANDEKLGYGLKEGYARGERLKLTGRALYPKTGWPKRPQFIWTPVKAADAKAEPEPDPEPDPAADKP